MESSWSASDVLEHIDWWLTVSTLLTAVNIIPPVEIQSGGCCRMDERRDILGIVIQMLTLAIAISSLLVSISSRRISGNVRDMTIPNGYYYVTIFSNKNISGTKYLIENHYSVDIQYYGSVPPNT